ncbi:Unknown protein sequence [Pseudomonas coronafaciens pv. oryzae]|nr:Unknown protein sequence [Pseudomonas coronafaciens pv. oryzae]
MGKKWHASRYGEKLSEVAGGVAIVISVEDQKRIIGMVYEEISFNHSLIWI